MVFNNYNMGIRSAHCNGDVSSALQRAELRSVCGYLCTCIHIATYNSSPAPQFFLACIHSIFISPVSGSEPWFSQISKIYSFAQKHRFCKLYQTIFSSVTQLCPTLCDPTDCSTPGFPVHYQRPEFTQIHVHRVGDAIQPSHPLSSPLNRTGY